MCFDCLQNVTFHPLTFQKRTKEKRAAKIHACGRELNKETQLLSEEPPPPREMSAAQWAPLFPSFTTRLGGDAGVGRKGHQNPLRTQALSSIQCSLFGVPHSEEPLCSPAHPWLVGGSWRSHFPAGCSGAQAALWHFSPHYSRARQLLITCNKVQLWSVMKWSCAA